jgi:hypothetical protein
MQDVDARFDPSKHFAVAVLMDGMIENSAGARVTMRRDPRQQTYIQWLIKMHDTSFFAVDNAVLFAVTMPVFFTARGK